MLKLDKDQIQQLMYLARVAKTEQIQELTVTADGTVTMKFFASAAIPQEDNPRNTVEQAEAVEELVRIAQNMEARQDATAAIAAERTAEEDDDLFWSSR